MRIYLLVGKYYELQVGKLLIITWRLRWVNCTTMSSNFFPNCGIVIWQNNVGLQYDKKKFLIFWQSSTKAVVEVSSSIELNISSLPAKLSKQLWALHCLSQLFISNSTLYKISSHMLSSHFVCLPIQNHQAVHSTRRLMNRTVKDNMVNGLFFCTTLTSRKRGHTPFVQAGAETTDTGAEAVEPMLFLGRPFKEAGY